MELESKLQSNREAKASNFLSLRKRILITSLFDSVLWGVFLTILIKYFSRITQNEIAFQTLISIFGMFCILSLVIFLLWNQSLGFLLKKLDFFLSKVRIYKQNIEKTMDQVQASSKQLSDSISNQASAVHETAASMDQVSAMVKKSAENSSLAKDLSTKSYQAAEKGRGEINEMIQAISEINKSNLAIVAQVEEGNRQFAEIVKIIGEIESKTKVINDIVFQTKLLSFNAAVESARAGESGKGFAVVAEEIGNLAEMSGSAAKEISDVLQASVKKAESIMTTTKSAVEALVSENKSRLEFGVQVSQQCSTTLNHVLLSVQEANHRITEISTASKEQALGVDQVNKAINELNQAIQTNSSVAQDTAKASTLLGSETVELGFITEELKSVLGNSNNNDEGQIFNVLSKPKPEEKISKAKINFGVFNKNKDASDIKAAPKKNIVQHKKDVKLEKPVVAEKKEKLTNLFTKVTPLPVKKKAKAEFQGGVPSRDNPNFEDI